MIDFGIDLGTTNSAVARCVGDDVRVFKNRDQMDVTPSVVRIEKTGRIIVGRRAYQTLHSDPDNTAAEFKRLMGQSDRRVFPGANKSLSSEELSKEVLSSLAEDVRRHEGQPLAGAVITVPAAFGQLQCEATARAASLSGLLESPLLQEPLAASIAYGMKADSRDKRWLVYDLGGGTFDIALVSTKGGRLSVLEHRGNNMLGGKDFDRLIVEKIFWPKLSENFKMPADDGDPSRRRRWMQVLRGKAEEAKIDLSQSPRVTVSLFDIGEDETGRAVEVEFDVTRADLEKLVTPLLLETVGLCREVLTGARMTSRDLSNVLLVGGPTFMPILREVLTTELGAPLDHSLDPMTVVVRGAAVYASTVPFKAAPLKVAPVGSVAVELIYEPVWSETSCLVAGRLTSPIVSDLEIRLDAESGHWTSGWLPIKDAYFESRVQLLEGKTNKFWVYLRDKKGQDIPPTADSFSIRHGLTLAEPPLPHSIGVEVVGADGAREIDVVFPRSTPLPAEKRIHYKAVKTLTPDNPEDYLAIKVWEGERFSDPEANSFVGALKISAADVRRPLPVDSDIETSISLSASRLMKVESFVPVLGQHFQERVYIAQENQEEIVAKVDEVACELNEQTRTLARLEEMSEKMGDADGRARASELREKLRGLREEGESLSQRGNVDPDDAKRLNEGAKEIRAKLGDAERKIRGGNALRLAMNGLGEAKGEAEELVEKWGSELEKKEFALLLKEADRAAEAEDEKGLKKVSKDIIGLKWRILGNQGWFWKQCFEELCLPGAPFVNTEEARRLLNDGKDAATAGDNEKLKKAVRALWELHPRSAAEAEQEKALKTGIRRRS
jgi:molecular chaperone DnaK